MTNSEHPDHTVPQGAVLPGSAQFCQTYLLTDFYGIYQFKDYA